MVPASSNPDTRQRPEWLRASLISGFVATFAMTVSMAIAYAVANGIGDEGGSRLERWFAALSANELTERIDEGFAVGMILNLVVGLVWAVIYAYGFEPRLSGPGWQRGALFALIPWIFSILVFFPIADLGVLGMDAGAGFLPALGNLVLHLVYGVVLGTMYGMESEGELADRQANDHSEQIAAVGLLLGAVLGGIGGWIVAPSLDGLAGTAVIAFAGALSGAAMGILIGSLLGLKIDEEPEQQPAARSMRPRTASTTPR